MNPRSNRFIRSLQIALMVLFTGGILALGLFVPKIEPNACVQTLRFPWGGTIAQNCDSPNIALTVNNIDQYMTEYSPWRTRPVYIFSIRAITDLLSPALTPISKHLLSTSSEIKASPYILQSVDWLNTYLACFIFNGLVVGSACATSIWALGTKNFWVKLGICGLIASSDVAIAWFWVPHQIIMNMLVPVGAVAAYLLGLRMAKSSRLKLAGIGFASGLVALLYPFCLIWPVLFGLGGLIGMSERSWPEARRVVLQLSLVAGAFLLPLLLWFVPYAVAGIPLSHEFNHPEQQQFSWLMRAWSEGTLGSELSERAVKFLGVVGKYLRIFGLALAVSVGAIAFVASRRQGLRTVVGDPFIIAVLVTALIMFGFNFLQGYHKGRLLLFPILMLGLTALRLLSMLRSERGQIAFGLAMTAIQLALVLSNPAISQE